MSPFEKAERKARESLIDAIIEAVDQYETRVGIAGGQFTDQQSRDDYRCETQYRDPDIFSMKRTALNMLDHMSKHTTHGEVGEAEHAAAASHTQYTESEAA